MQKSSVNKVILVGHIGNKPEGRYTSSGTSTATFSLATNESWIDSDKEKKEHTEWHNIVLWTPLAEIAENYLRKGSQVYIEGKISNRSYDDKDGVKKYISEVVGREIKLLGKAPEQPGVGKEKTNTTEKTTSTEDDLPF